MIAPAVAAKGFPVIAIQFFPCSGGFCVGCDKEKVGEQVIRIMSEKYFMQCVYSLKLLKEGIVFTAGKKEAILIAIGTAEYLGENSFNSCSLWLTSPHDLLSKL